MMAFLWVFIGGGVGACARYALGSWMVRRVGESFPFGTLAINVTGSLLIGIVVTLLAERGDSNSVWRLTLVVGFLGGYTTFSTFSHETVRLIQDGQWDRALIYVVASNLAAVIACLLGVVIGRFLVQ